MIPTHRPPTLAPALSHSIRAHSLFWLLAANTVGLLLATLLLFPELNTPLAPLTYGRWMPLHLNWHLYGWCALPLIGALLVYFRAPSSSATGTPDSRPTLWAWSLALALGGLSWLTGTVSGKLFVDWHGWARPLLPVAMLILWTTLALQPQKTKKHFAVLAALLPIPFVFYWACSRDVYPTVNPHSGGATGTALLGSTLGIVAIFALLPRFLGVPLKPQYVNRPDWLNRATFVFSVLVFVFISHGNDSHHELSQMLGLGTLLLWGPFSWLFLVRHQWHEAERPWVRAGFIWWFLLLHTGWITFLPGVSERLKFTHALVAHSHLAMAGLISSVHFVILQRLDLRRPLRGGFWLWQTGTALNILALATIGWLESKNPGELFYGAAWVDRLFMFRLLAGVVMWSASLLWFRQVLRSAGETTS